MANPRDGRQQTHHGREGEHATPERFLPMAVAVAWLVAAVLLGFWRNAHDIIGRSEVAAATLLIVPALIAGFLVRPQEHAVATRVLRVPRVLTTLVAAMPLFAAALLVVISEPETPPLVRFVLGDEIQGVDWKLRAGWGASCVVAFALAIALTMSWRLPRVARPTTAEASHARAD